MIAVGTHWQEANQRYLAAALAEVSALLAGAQDDRLEPLADLGATMPAPPAIEQLSAAFGLTSFERDLVLLCAGVELDSAFAAACAEAQVGPGGAQPTFGLALATLRDAHWSALTPAAPLRRWRLIEVAPGRTLTSAALTIDERVLHFLAGVSHLDERLVALLEPVAGEPRLPASREALRDRIVDLWAGYRAGGAWPVVQLCGADAGAAREVFAAACSRLGLQAYVMRAADVPVSASERDALARLWEREAALGPAALMLERDDEDSVDATRSAVRLLECTGGPLVLSARDPAALRARTVVRLTIPTLAAAERFDLWRTELGPFAAQLDGQVDAVAVHFALGSEAVRAAAAAALGHGAPEDPWALWHAARAEARPRLDDLAQRIEPCAGWGDLVVPEPQRRILHEIIVHVRQRARVYGSWGFAAKSGRGLGISALFSGPSGTGKTMAAEVIALELRLDLYRIDLSAVVSKYIGETEKNLRRVFDAAEAGGAILLFDEADALFGKRSEVRDSHDRYANIEIGYLLQRMEAYQGLAILTTNMRSALDSAFLRRLRFVVQFPFPDASQRAEIWRRIFPADTPTDGLDPDRLARLDVTGGSIRNIALGAAFLAADADVPVRPEHLVRAARSEVAKLERPVTEAEIGGWA